MFTESLANPYLARPVIAIDGLCDNASPINANTSCLKRKDPVAQLVDQRFTYLGEGTEIDCGRVRDKSLYTDRPHHFRDTSIGFLGRDEKPAHRGSQVDDPG